MRLLSYVTYLFCAMMLLNSTFTLAKDKNAWIAQSDLDYLPDNVSYDPTISKPEDILGYPVGKWHVRHDQIVTYMKTLAAQSDRITITTTGRTHEDRELLLLTITAPKHQANIAQIQQTHLRHIAQGSAPAEDAPLVFYMGYSVHGNEPSGSNASLLIAYYLAAAQGPQVDALLENSIILLDPSLNPDGLSRFAQWANMHKGKNPSPMAMHREHAERFPSGRTNHYWFDLNRDWLLLTHPESQARIESFHAWRPHILTDFHEMGTHSTYFFQPGVPSRKNPLTGDENVQLTNTLGDFHAKALDNTQQLYFTQERFDDFYYGKGSTYPDAHGAVGILFEQASSRGHLQHSVNGLLSFPASIRNQVTTSFSTFDGAMANKSAFLNHHANFTAETKALIKADELGGFVVALSKDNTRNSKLVDTLNRHQIEVGLITEDIKVDGVRYNANKALLIRANQPQYRLIKSLFSTRQDFPNNTFYDVSNWNIALAYNLQYAAVSKSVARRTASTVLTEWLADVAVDTQLGVVAYAFHWDDSQAPSLLYALSAAGVQTRIAGQAFSAVDMTQNTVSFAPGSVVIPKGLNSHLDVVSVVARLATKYQIQIVNIKTGLTPTGIDLGSPDMQAVRLPSVMILGGLGVSQYEAGEVWHYLDTRLDMPVAIVDKDRLNRVDLTDYTHMIIVSGTYSSLTDSDTDKIERWVKAGGVLIGQRTGLRTLVNNQWLNASIGASSAIDNAVADTEMRYIDRSKINAKKQVAGAVYAAQVDASHPLMWGLDVKDNVLPVFKTNNLVLRAADKPYFEVAKYTTEPLLAGYTDANVESIIADTTAIVAHRVGQGRVIGFTDNMNHRGYWRGTEKLMANAIFMAPFINYR